MQSWRCQADRGGLTNDISAGHVIRQTQPNSLSCPFTRLLSASDRPAFISHELVETSFAALAALLASLSRSPDMSFIEGLYSFFYGHRRHPKTLYRTGSTLFCVATASAQGTVLSLTLSDE